MFLSSAKLVRTSILAMVLGLLSACATAPLMTHGKSKLPEVSDQSFQAEVLDAPLPVLVEFYAAKCDSCEAVESLLSIRAIKHASWIKVVRLNAENNPSIAARYRNRAVPHLILFNQGDVVDEMLGVPSQERLDASINKVRR